MKHLMFIAMVGMLSYGVTVLIMGVEPTTIVYASENPGLVVEYIVKGEEKEVVKKTTKERVHEYFSDIPVMIEVARCESTFTHMRNGEVLTGYVDKDDTGVMQINKRYHDQDAMNMGLNLEKLEDNMKFARHLFETQGIQPWSASFKCMNI